MRTTINLRDDLLRIAKKKTHASSTSDAVNAALADWARRLRVDKIKAMAGKIHFDGNLGKLRDMDLEKR